MIIEILREPHNGQMLTTGRAPTLKEVQRAIFAGKSRAFCGSSCGTGLLRPRVRRAAAGGGDLSLCMSSDVSRHVCTAWALRHVESREAGCATCVLVRPCCRRPNSKLRTARTIAYGQGLAAT